MKILVIHNEYLESGGEDEVVNSEIELLRGFGHQVILFKCSNREIDKLSLFDKGIFLINEAIFSKETYSTIKDIVKLEKPDVAHIHNIFLKISPSVYSALREEDVPIVQTLHNYRFLCPKGIFYRNGKICQRCVKGNYFWAIIFGCWRGSRLATFFLTRVINNMARAKVFERKIDGYISLSDFSKAIFSRHGFSEDRIFVKPNFVNVDAEHSMENAGEFVLFAGRIADYKGINTFIRAIKKLPNVKFVIIGDGPLFRKISRLPERLKNISLTGRLSNEKTIEYMKKSRFVVFPSECYETFGRIVIEAFACGKPVVASNLESMSEIIQDRKTGMLFNVGDSNDLAAKIQWLWDNSQNTAEMGMLVRKEFENKYSRLIAYKKLLEIYEFIVYNNNKFIYE